MCKYCEFEKNGDYPDDHEDLIAQDDQVMTASACVEQNGLRADISIEKRFGIWADISPHGELHIMLIGSSQIYGDDKEIIFKEKINYCPMCGRKL